ERIHRAQHVGAGPAADLVTRLRGVERLAARFDKVDQRGDRIKRRLPAHCFDSCDDERDPERFLKNAFRIGRSICNASAPIYRISSILSSQSVKYRHFTAQAVIER
ncbi:MAG TPA: hypothetical protein VGN31_00925, partial [Paraburkholderia sp.]